MYICVCASITENTVDEEIKKGNDTLPKLIEVLNVASVCETCYDDLEEFIKSRLNSHVEPSDPV